METAPQQVPLTGLAKELVAQNLLSEQSAVDAAAKATDQELSLIRYLSQSGEVDPVDLASAASKEFGLPIFDLDAMEFDPGVKDLVSEKLIRKHAVLPLFKRGQKLYLAISDPTNFAGFDEINFSINLNAEPVLVEHAKLTKAIDQILEESDTTRFDDFGDEELEDLDIISGDDEDATAPGDSDIDDAPIVRYVNKILLDAINQGASDLHFEPYEKKYRIRFRIDGVLHNVASPPLSLARKITSRLKVLSSLDISERRVPQDGRMKMKISKNRSIDFRVSTCPTLFGEKVVMRILDPSSATLGIDALGYEPFQKEIFLENLAKPYGMILITGPTGSGKTVSLYTGINILNKEGTNISTAEDPAEIVLEGVNQVNINHKQGLTFPAALKSFLRQDPDVILIGEIRDLETGEIAIKAAQTGHAVLATLHTNDAPQTIARLMNMGLAPYNIAGALNLIIAQRLARRLCKHCKTETQVPREALLAEGFTAEDLAEHFTLYKAVGCDQCTNGYKGRAGIYQVMPISEEMRQLILVSADQMTIAKQADEEGVWDLRKSGLNKVKQGITTLEEINRITKD